MHPLVDDLASARQLRVCTPFSFVTQPATVTVTAPQVQHLAVNTRAAPRLLHGQYRGGSGD